MRTTPSEKLLLGALTAASLTALFPGCGSTVEVGQSGADGGGGAGAGVATSSSNGGAGGNGATTTSGMGGMGEIDCALLSEGDCGMATECVPLYRNDEIVPNAPPPPPGTGPPVNECCWGCFEPTCQGCHPTSYSECVSDDACEQAPDTLCGMYPPDACG